MPDAMSKEFMEQSIYRIQESTKRVLTCLKQVDEEKIWASNNGNSNSIGNLILHLCGNIRQYIVSALGDMEDTRMRDLEFSTRSGFTKDELSNRLNNTVSQAVQVIKTCDEVKLLKVFSVQGFRLSGIGIIIHVTEHYSYHTGQIAFRTKQLIDKDLKFYGGVDLNAKNKN